MQIIAFNIPKILSESCRAMLTQYSENIACNEGNGFENLFKILGTGLNKSIINKFNLI